MRGSPRRRAEISARCLHCSTTMRCCTPTTARLAAHSTRVNIDGMPGVAAVLDGRVVSLMAFELRGDRITALHVLADPDRIGQLGVESVLARES